MSGAVPTNSRADGTTATTDGRVDRWAEMVAALSGCHLEAARIAVQRTVDQAPGGFDNDADSLAIVAQAMVSVRRGLDLREDDAAR